MKKLFTILITLALLCAVGCEEQGNDNVNPNEKPDIENPEDKPDDQIPDDAYIIINKELVTFSPDGESVDIKVYSNYEWKLTNNCDWVTTSVAGGEASDTGTTVTLTAALTYDNHEGTITFSCGKAKKLLVVSQSLKETIIADGNNTFSVSAKGGKVIINYQTSVECEVVIPEESKSWISITPATRALVSESATLTVKENTSYSERNAVVKVVKVGDNTLSAKYTISQKPADKPSVSDTPLADIPCAANEILYTTKYDLPIELGNTQGFGGNLVYNTYENGIGKLTFGNDVTAIPEKAFYNCNSMESIKLPDGIKSVGAYAFRNCSSLTTFCGKLASEDGGCLIVNGVLEAFAFGSGRTEYIIPNGVTEIGENAFRDCTSLNSITIPDSVTTIGYSAFFCCTSLASVTIGNGVTSIGSSAFYGCTGELIINSKIVETDYIADNYPFYYGWLKCSNFTSLVIGDSVTSIGDYAFSGCTSLTSVTIPDGVTEIGDEAFWCCSSLTSVTIPDSVTSIGWYAFSDCTSLTSVTIPNSVTSIGYEAFRGCSSLTSVYITDIVAWCVIRFGSSSANPLAYAQNLYLNGELVTDLVIPDGVTSIGNYAFSGCTSLTSITIPDSVIFIGSSTFDGCTGELTVNCNIPDGRYVNYKYYSVFSSSKFTKVTIGNDVTSIGSGAFYGCTSLTSVTIGNGVTSIGSSAFYGCTGELIINSKIVETDYTPDNYPFYYGWLKCSNFTSLVIGDSVTSIGNYAFHSCSSLTSVTIPNSVVSIGNNAFQGCTGELIINSNIAETDYTPDNYPSNNGWLQGSYFTSLVIGDSVTNIGEYAFYACYSLTSITIPDGVTSIGDYAFYFCSSLTSITIPDSVTEIGSSAFVYCVSLKTFYGKFASNDNRCLIVDGVLNSFAPAGLTVYTIPDSVTSIGNEAFRFCYSLTSITIPDSVTEIGSTAFAWCSSLTNVTIGNGVTKIGDFAFSNCTSLTSVTIGNGVTLINWYAFYGCSSLTEVYCKPTTPPNGGSDIFDDNASGRKIYVPTESVEAYRAANYWSNYAADIVGYDFGGGENTTTPPANEIWYTNGSTTEPTTPNKTDVFGATYVSNTYDAEKGCWVIKFDGDVTSIGNFAFDGYTSLTSITIPDSVTSIGEYAFRNCESLTSAIIGNGVIEIGYKAFRGCTSLTSITIPDSVTSIGDDAFLYCDSLTSVTIGNGVVEIGDWAFKNCESLTSITIPDSVTEIGEEAFRDCTSLTSFYGKFASDDNRCLIIDGTLTSFAPAGLTAYTIPDSVTSIGEYAFEGCSSLTSITIPDSVTSIEWYAFSGCKSLTSITIPDSVTSIGVAAFSDCASLTSVTIPNSVTSIGNSVFRNCVSLKTFYGKFASNDNRCLIVDGVLNSFAPAGLTVYTIPDSVTSIGVAAFRDCASLTNVTIGKGVKTIGNYAFEGCSSLTEVYCKPTTPPRGGYYIFSYYNNYTYRPIGCKIYVPAASVETYKTAEYWSEYAADIVGYDF